jgi:hypothetical protein
MADDKKKHLIAGFLIALATFAVFMLFAPHLAGYSAFCAAALAGALKEAYDATGRGHVEFLDFVATTAGGLPFLIWGFYG